MSKKLPATKVFGHPRSGNHFLAAALTMNFWPEEYPSYSARFYSNNHAMASFMRPKIAEKPNWKFVYIYREWPAVARSIWKMRRRWGITSKTFSEFEATRWKDQWSGKRFARAITARVKSVNGEPRFGASRFFSGRPYTPYDFWNTHCVGWFSLGREFPNVYIVKYEELTHPETRNFAMSLLANRLGIENERFFYKWPENQVGFVPAEE